MPITPQIGAKNRKILNGAFTWKGLNIHKRKVLWAFIPNNYFGECVCVCGAVLLFAEGDNYSVYSSSNVL